MTVLAYVVYHKDKALTVYTDREQAKWCAFLLGRGAHIKTFTSRVLLQLLARGK